MMAPTKEDVKNVYYDEKSPSYLSSARRIADVMERERKKPANIKDVADFLLSSDRIFGQYYRKRKRFPRRIIHQTKPFDILSMDLADFQVRGLFVSLCVCVCVCVCVCGLSRLTVATFKED